MITILLAYFGWPYGAVWSNLIASLICVIVAYLKLRAQLNRQHLAQIAHQNHLHEALKLHLSGKGGGPGGDGH